MTLHIQISETIPKISVVMPTFNAGRYIQEAIESVLKQTFQNWELIIIDDASTDDTSFLVRKFNDPRIRYYHLTQRRKNPSAVRNIGIQYAQGEYVAFLDADDLYEPEALFQFVTYLDNNVSCQLAYGFYREIDSQGQWFQKSLPWLVVNESGVTTLPVSYQQNWESVLTGKTIHQMTFVTRKQVFDELGLFPEKILFAEDLVFYLKLFQADFNSVQPIPAYLYRYRKYETSVCYDADRFYDVLESLSKFSTWLVQEANLPEEAKTHFSKCLTSHYAYYLRTRYEGGSVSQVFQAAFKALQEPEITFSDWFSQCFPFVVRVMLPRPLERMLKRGVQSLQSQPDAKMGSQYVLQS